MSLENLYARLDSVHRCGMDRPTEPKPVTLDEKAARQLRRIARGEVSERHPRERRRALALLARLRPQGSEGEGDRPHAVLEEVATGDAQPELRPYAVSALARRQGSAAARVLRTLVTRADEHSAVALAAARALVEHGVRDAANDLRGLHARMAKGGYRFPASRADLEHLIEELDEGS